HLLQRPRVRPRSGAATARAGRAVRHGSFAMRNVVRSMLAVAVTLLGAGSAPAAAPSVINYQGRLTDNSPQQVPIDATVSVEFSIWDASTGGASLWTETQSVQVVKGLFNVLLGSTIPVP